MQAPKKKQLRTPHDVATHETEDQRASPDTMHIEEIGSALFLYNSDLSPAQLSGSRFKSRYCAHRKSQKDMEAVRLVFALRREEVCEDAGDDDEDEANDQACTVDGRTVSSKIQKLSREQRY